MTVVAEQTGRWLDQFTQQPAAEPWLKELRDSAFQRFLELGFPATHEEEWRFTNVAPIARTQFANEHLNWETARGSLPTTFFNGKYVAAALPEGVSLGTPEDLKAHLGKYASYHNHPFIALNTAFLRDVAVLRIDRGAVVDEPVRFLYGAAETHPPVAAHPRVLVLAGAHSQCTLVETYAAQGKYFTNAVTEIVAGEGAVVDHYRVQSESTEAYHIGILQAMAGRNANFTSHSISLGGLLVRNDANVALSEGTEATLNGLYIANGQQHVDNHTQIDHAKPHGTSHELYKGILDGHATAVFNGRIIVRKDAQKTDSKQTNKNLLLSDDAVINTKPELQILADDVRCTHGATIGQLDAEALFYLQSRGIGKGEARDLLTYAFAQDIVDRVKIPALKDYLEKVLFEKFHEHVG